MLDANPSRLKRVRDQALLSLMTLCLLLGVCVNALARSEPDRWRDGVIERRWLADPESSLSPQAALAGDWTPFKSPLSRGFTSSTTWVRLTIDPAAAGQATLDADQRIVLRIAPGHLDDVAVYRVGQLEQPPVMVGDTHPLQGPIRSVMNYSVVFDEVTGPFELLLRLRTQSNHTIDVDAMRWDAAQRRAAGQLTLVVGYLVFTAMAVVWATVAWLERRVAVLGWFILHQGSVLAVAFCLLGVLRVHGPEVLTPAFVNLFTSVCVTLSAGLTMLFHSKLLSDLGAARSATRLLWVVAAFPGLGLALIALGQVRWALTMTQLSILVGMPVTVLIAWWARPVALEDSTSRRMWRRAYVVLVYATMAAIMIPSSLRVVGLLPAGRWTLIGPFAYGVASTLLLGSLLMLRAREERQSRRKEEQVYAQAQREAESQRSRATEQAELMTMLTHELKTPLTVLSLALGNASQQVAMRERAHRAIQNMRDVIDRCAQAAMVDDDLARDDVSPSLGPVALDTVLAEAVSAQLEAGRVDVIARSDLPNCLADRQMLLVVITNLLENALKYSPEDSRVVAETEPTVLDGHLGVVLRVTNQVGLVGPPDRERVFEKYHRGQRARHRSGSGLGLYLSRRLAERMGARLSLREPVDDRVCFELWVAC